MAPERQLRSLAQDFRQLAWKIPRFTSDLTAQEMFPSTAPRQAVIFTIIVSLKAIVLNWAWSGCGAEGYPSGQRPLVTVLSTFEVRNLLADGKNRLLGGQPT